MVVTGADASTAETMSATGRIDASPEAVFGVLADPGSHAAIDGTGWVCEALDTAPLTAAGQVFRMAMYHSDHPNGGYVVANEVQVLSRPHVIAWRPGYDTDDGTLAFGGWVWRYDLDWEDGGTQVTLSYDWSAITDEARKAQSFPPFGVEHLIASLDHLADLARATTPGQDAHARRTSS